MPVPAGCDRCDQFARVVQTDLAAIGIDVRLRTIQASVDDDPRAAKRFDMAALEARLPYPDSPAFLEQVLHGIPRQWVQPEVGASLDRAARAIGDHRQTLAADLARSITTRDIVVAAFGTTATSQFLSSRLGCQVLPPVGFGVDLAALCLVPT
jgi:hypothetical protein